MQFAYRVERWSDDGNSIVEHVGGLCDLIVARAAYKGACRRWPQAKLTLRQGARVIEQNWDDLEVRQNDQSSHAKGGRGRLSHDV
jgi:hypothetical protein